MKFPKSSCCRYIIYYTPGGSVVKKLPANVGDMRGADSIPGSGRSPRGGHGSTLQYSCLENLMDRGAWQATVHGVTKSQTWLKQLSTHIRAQILYNVLPVLCLVTQSCPTLCDPLVCGHPVSSIHAIFQAGILQWIAISFWGSSWPGDRTHVSYVSCIAG